MTASAKGGVRIAVERTWDAVAGANLEQERQALVLAAFLDTQSCVHDSSDPGETFLVLDVAD